MVRHYILFGGLFILIAAVIFIRLVTTRRKGSKPAAGNDEPDVPEPQDDEGHKHALPDNVTDLTDAGPKHTVPEPPEPLGKNPPRPKRPKLIQ